MMLEKLKSYVLIARPHQYVKNLFVWLPLFFGYKLGDTSAIIHTGYMFMVFSLAASGIYTLNDIKDIKEDQRHPVKKHRPLAKGALSVGEAAAFCTVLLAVSFALSCVISSTYFIIISIYVGLNVGYSFFLKHIAIIDIMCIATGFVLRVYAGGVAAGVDNSHWIVMMTFLLALFLALAKRRDDLMIFDNSGYSVRKSLDGYNVEFVSLGMGIMASVIIVSYILYTVSPEITAKHGTSQLYLTGIWVIAGILRYLQMTVVEGRSGSPTQILLKDYFLQTIILIWVVSFYLLIY